jgi:hypothetical protein
VIAVASVVRAAPPANDDFANAITIPGIPYTNSQSTAEATTQAGEPAPCASIGSTVWYSFTPTRSGPVGIDTIGSSYDTALAVYTGNNLGALDNVACNDDTFDLQSLVSFNATAGTTYHIQAGGYQGNTGNLMLNLEELVPPRNDNLANAIRIATPPFTDSKDTRAATNQNSEPQPCAGIGSTAWYSFTPARSGVVEVDTLGSNYDTALAVYIGGPFGTFINVDCDDDALEDNLSFISFRAIGGVTYFIQAGGYDGAGGELVINLDQPLPPTNDNFNNALRIRTNPFTDRKDTRLATDQASEPQACGSIENTVWYSFTPTENVSVEIDTVGSDYDTVLAVYTGNSLSRLNDVACNNDAGGDLHSSVSFVAMAGTTYRIQVGGFQGDSGTLLIDLDHHRAFRPSRPVRP